MKKQTYLEAIRGLAALIVVFCHYLSAFYPSSILGNIYRSHASWESLFYRTPMGIAAAGQFAVCIFFVLSGYVLSLAYFGDKPKDANHLLAALVKRPFRLAGVVVAAELIAFCLMHSPLLFNDAVSALTYSDPWFKTPLVDGIVGFKRFFLDITTSTFAAGAKYNPPLWTIEIELYGSILTFGFLLLFRNSNLRYLAYLLAVLYFRGKLYQGFIFGIFFADISRNQAAFLAQSSKGLIGWALLAIGLLFASYPYYVDHATLARTFYSAFPPIPFFAGEYTMLGAILVFPAVLILPALQDFLSLSSFAFLGRVSYALYATHYLVLESFSSWLFLRVYPALGYHASFAVTLFSSLLILFPISYLVTVAVDQPATRLANYIGKIWLKSTDANASPKKWFGLRRFREIDPQMAIPDEA